MNKNKADLDFLVAFDWQSGGDVRQNVSDKPMLQSNQVPAVASFDQSLSPTNRSAIEIGAKAPSVKSGDCLSVFMAGQGTKAGGIAESETTSPTLKGSESGLNRVPSVALAGHSSSKWAKGTGGSAGDEVQNLVASPLAGHHTRTDLDNETYVPLGGVRRLTPTECERLQGFPDGWTAWGLDENGKEVQQSDSARYKQLGNAVSVPPVEWIGKRIKDVHEKENR